MSAGQTVGSVCNKVTNWQRADMRHFKPAGPIMRCIVNLSINMSCQSRDFPCEQSTIFQTRYSLLWSSSPSITIGICRTTRAPPPPPPPMLLWTSSARPYLWDPREAILILLPNPFPETDWKQFKFFRPKLLSFI